MKMKEFLLLLVNKILNSVIGGGLFCGFMTTATVGLGYFFVVASFFIKDKQFFIKDNQRRVAAMTGFVTGQFVMFTSIYNRPLHEGLVQPHSIIMLFLGSFFVQLFWTSRKTLRNRRFLDPDDLITKRKHVLRLQFEFIRNFFVQLCNPYLEPDSMIPKLVNFCLSSYRSKQSMCRGARSKEMGVIYKYSLEKTCYSDPFLPGSAYQPSDKGSGRPVSAQSQ
jgi:hypothetical protein